MIFHIHIVIGDTSLSLLDQCAVVSEFMDHCAAVTRWQPEGQLTSALLFLPVQLLPSALYLSVLGFCKVDALYRLRGCSRLVQ
jgi:hypothetical protein